MCSQSSSTRREFLQGKSALAAAAAVASSAIGPEALPALTAESALLRLGRRAMACEFEIYFNAGQYASDTLAGVAALDLVDLLEDQLSVYRDASEISRLNRRAADEAVAVEPGLFALLETAVRIHVETGGTYDVTAGQLSNIWGFTRRSGRMPDGEQIAAALACVGSEYLELDGTIPSVRFLLAGIEINLGSIGKGYTLDRCAELLEAEGIHDFLLHGGNSSVLARGAHAGESQGWLVGVRDPLHPVRRLGLLQLQDRALATSGSGTQFFMHEGRRYGHILDPRSGWPADGVLSTSVIAPSAAEADALSTAFYVMGPVAAAAYCRLHPEIQAVMLCPGKRAGSLEQHRFNLSEGQWSETQS